MEVGGWWWLVVVGGGGGWWWCVCATASTVHAFEPAQRAKPMSDQVEARASVHARIDMWVGVL